MLCMAAVAWWQETVADEMPATLEQTDSLGTHNASPDTVAHDGDYWKRQLRMGKLDLNDETIVYPSFLHVCEHLSLGRPHLQ